MNLVNNAAFIDRKSELSFLKAWIVEEPKDILFIYGPKSSGKTTLINRFIETWDKQKTEFRLLNLREVFIAGYGDFVKAFFGIDPKGEKKTIKVTTEYGVKLFSLKREVINALENNILDPFQVMKKELEKLNKKGKRPVLILDELQALEDIYLNEQRLLIKELFNFFVAMTKESHLCHILICGSDGYFMERIYNDSRLKKTSNFFKVDYLTKKDVMHWLDNLERESNIKSYSLDESQKEATWEMFGGSMWEISRFLGDLILYAKDSKIPDETFIELIKKKKIQMRSHFVEYAGLTSSSQKLCAAMDNEIKRKKFFSLDDFDYLIDPKIFIDEFSLRGELRRLVSNNFIAYDPVTAQYSMQGKSMEHGLRMYNEMKKR